MSVRVTNPEKFSLRPIQCRHSALSGPDLKAVGRGSSLKLTRNLQWYFGWHDSLQTDTASLVLSAASEFLVTTGKIRKIPPHRFGWRRS